MMRKKLLYIVYFAVTVSLCACGKHEKAQQAPAIRKPQVKDNGRIIEFSDTASINSFSTQPAEISDIQAQFNAPARVVATIINSVESEGQHLVLFDNPDLTNTYTALLQHMTNVNTYKSNLNRVKDLAQNGAATGKEVIEAETQLANEKADLIEFEAKLKLAGLDPEDLIHAKVNSVWMICDIPETQIGQLKINSTCNIVFSSFPDKIFVGKIDDFGDVVDQTTRMVKLRISVNNPNHLLRAGMFATVKFDSKEGTSLTVPKNAIVIVQGKTYLFVKTAANQFERREVQVSDQPDDETVVFKGLSNNEQVAVTGVMQLKGLSFGF